MNEDARTLPASAQEEKRKQAVRMWKTGSYTQSEIGEQVGVHYLTIGRWIRKYQEGGAKSLQAKPRGRQEGSGRWLTPVQETLIQKRLIDKTPDDQMGGMKTRALMYDGRWHNGTTTISPY